MTKITLNIPDTKLNFFLELVEQLGIEVSKNETDIPDWQKEIVRERLKNAKDENLNAERFLNALAGPNGEKITFNKIESCCPFPTKRSEMGAGFLDVYELQWEGQTNPVKLYLNIYERGYLLVPVGLSIKK